jgi:hypothetical protein
MMTMIKRTPLHFHCSHELPRKRQMPDTSPGTYHDVYGICRPSVEAHPETVKFDYPGGPLAMENSRGANIRVEAQCRGLRVVNETA